MPISTPSNRAASCGAELAPMVSFVSIDKVRKPWAIVVPNGVAFAASGSTWMNWWSWVTSANWLIWSCVTSNHSPVPSSFPTSAWNSLNALAAASPIRRTLIVTVAPMEPGDHYVIITADSHAGGSHKQYREFLDPKYRDDFDA